MQKINIWALFGESGAGKDFILNKILSCINDTHKIVSYTTRPPRDYEKDGEDYYFIKEKDFKRMIHNDEFIEYANFNNWFYGTAWPGLKFDKINVGVFNIEGIETLLKNDKVEVNPIRIQTKDSIRMLRAIQRESKPNYYEILRRFAKDREDFKNISFHYDTIHNDYEDKDSNWDEYLNWYFSDLVKTN